MKRTVLMVALIAGVAVWIAAVNPGDREVRSEQQEADVAALRLCREGIQRVVQDAASRPDLFPTEKQERELPELEDRTEIRDFWTALMDHYVVLDDIRARHGDFMKLEDSDVGSRSYHIYRAALLTEYRFALEFLKLTQYRPACDVLLNEPVPSLGLPDGTFDRFRFRFLNVLKAGEFLATESVAKTFGDCPWPDLRGWANIDRREILGYGVGKGELMTVKNGLHILKTGGSKAWLPIQKRLAGWMGETRVRRKGEYLISPKQITSFADQLRPGDVLLERREWYLTNVGIPGYWTHAAIYVGTPAERTAYFDTEDVRGWLEQHNADSLEQVLKQTNEEAYDRSLKSDEHGFTRRVVEAIAKGVVFTSLEYTAHCDSLAVLRPRLSRKDKAVAIVRAYGYAGRPYDYQFDFLSDQALVCTELVFKSYEPGSGMTGLDLPKEKLMGHLVTPANAFARMTDAEWGREDRQLDLVLFYDGLELEGRAVQADSDTFRSTWERPKWHILFQDPEDVGMMETSPDDSR